MFGLNKSIYWIAGGQVVGLLNNFLLLKILTFNLSVASYGYFTLWISLLLFARQIIYDPISIVAAKEAVTPSILLGSSSNTFQVVSYLTKQLTFCFLLVGIISVLLEIFLHHNVSTGIYIFMGCLYLLANGAQGIYLNMLNALKERRWAAIGIASDSSVKLIIVLLAFLYGGADLNYAIQAVAVSALVVYIFILRISHQFDGAHSAQALVLRSDVNQLIKLSLPFIAPSLLTALKGFGDKIFMASFIGIEELAAYNVLLQLGFIPMVLVLGVIQTYLTPDIYKWASQSGTDNKKKNLIYIRGVLLGIFIITTTAVLASFFISEIVFKYLVGVKYSDYVYFLPYFVLAGGFAGISSLLNVVVIGVLQPKQVGILMFLSVLAGLALVIILIIMYGLEGGIYGLIGSNFLMAIIYGGTIYWKFSENK